MTDPASFPTNVAGERIDPERDRVTTALRGLGGGTLVGTGVEALLLTLVSHLVAAGPAPVGGAPQVNGTFWLLFLGTGGAMVAGGAAAWYRIRVLTSVWRKALLASIAGFATFIGALAATPVHRALGLRGLAAFGIVVLGAGVLILRGGNGTRAGS